MPALSINATSHLKRPTLSLGIYHHQVIEKDVWRPPRPLMWSATSKVDSGVSLFFEHPFFTTSDLFSISYGVSISQWTKTRNYIDHIYIFSSFLAFKIWLPTFYRLQFYIQYSPGGPSLMSKKTFHDNQFSNHFVFQDQFGFGVILVKNLTIDLGLKLLHYSNADLFPKNDGFDVPILFQIGIQL